MTVAHSENPNATIGAQAFKSIVEGRSGGEIEVNLVIHHALGGDRDVIDQLMLGELEFYAAGSHALAAHVPDVQIFDWPYLITDRATFFGLMQDDEYREAVRERIFAGTGGMIRFLGAAENSVRHTYSVAGPIREPEDLAQLKLRVPPTPLNLELWQALGVGSVVGLSGAERNQALQTGLIDAIEGSVAGAWGVGHMDILDHVTLTGHVYSYMPYLVNEDFYQSLSESNREVIREAANLAIWVQNGHSITEEQQALAEIAAAGNTVTALTPDELARWQELAFPVGEEFIAKEVDPAFTEATLAAIERTRARLGR